MSSAASSLLFTNINAWYTPYVLLPLLLLLLLPLLSTILTLLYLSTAWIFWIVLSVAVGSLQVFYVVFQLCMILSSLSIMTTLKGCKLVMDQVSRAYPVITLGKCTTESQVRRSWRRTIDKCEDWGDYDRLLRERKVRVCRDRGDHDDDNDGDDGGNGDDDDDGDNGGECEAGSKDSSMKRVSSSVNFNGALADGKGSEESPASMFFRRSKSADDLRSSPALSRRSLKSSITSAISAARRLGPAPSSLDHTLAAMLKERNYMGVDDVVKSEARCIFNGKPFHDQDLLREIR